MNIELKQFLLYLERIKGYSPYTIRNYGFSLIRFFEIVKTRPPTSIHIKEYVEKLTEAGLSVRTINMNLHGIRTFAKFCKKYGYNFVDPKLIEFAKEPEREAEYLTTEEVENLIECIKPKNVICLRNKAMICLFYSAGLRLSELTALNLDDIDIQNKQVSIYGKGKMHRIAFFDDRTAFWLNAYVEQRESDINALFVTPHGRICNAQVETIVRGLCKKAGINKKASCHTLRHSFATHLLQKGADIMAIKDLLGHKHLSSTSIYLHNSNERLRQTHALLAKPLDYSLGAALK